ncbi:MAG: glutamyl-tRNA reductase [Chloroflexota bacterium]|jgi:glutamyl-tRNA reductase|nr:glutamyl-tRNA reductase [Chloroflexota bacterium]
MVEGLSHRVAPLEVRERVFIGGDELRGHLEGLRAVPALRGSAILSTCGRTEVYVTPADPGAAAGALDQLTARLSPTGDWRRLRYRLEGRAALEHLFRVPAGLDSAVIGEGQILGQFKIALRDAREAESTDSTLEFVMQRAIHVAKRVRTETAIGRDPVGFGHAAVVSARQVLGDLRGRSALVVGAGKMAGSTARALAGSGVDRIFFTSRTGERAAELAQAMAPRVTTSTVEHADLEAVAAAVDLIVCSSSAPDTLIGASMVATMMSRRPERPLVVLDLAVPRDVDPDVATIPGAHLFNLDDLGSAVEAGLSHRREELPAAEAIIAAEVDRATADLASRRADPAAAALVDEMEERRRLLLGALPADFTAAQAAEVERVTAVIARRLLHHPLVYLREHAADPDALARAREILGLAKDEEEA